MDSGGGLTEIRAKFWMDSGGGLEWYWGLDEVLLREGGKSIRSGSNPIRNHLRVSNRRCSAGITAEIIKENNT